MQPSISREPRHHSVPTLTPAISHRLEHSDSMPSSLHYDYSVSTSKLASAQDGDQSCSEHLTASYSTESEDLSMGQITTNLSFSEIPRLFSSTPQRSDKERVIAMIPGIFGEDELNNSNPSSDISLFTRDYQDIGQHHDLNEKSLHSMTPEQPTETLDASLLCPHFPTGHQLNPYFSEVYELGEELGSGGYGFVMTAIHRSEGYEVAVKFIIKSKVPEHAWTENKRLGRLPTEVMLLSFVDHKNIVKGLDLFEDTIYYYLVQELHGSPWNKRKRYNRRCVSSESISPATPYLSPSISTISLSSSRADSSPEMPSTPPNIPDALPEPHQEIRQPTTQRSNYRRRPSHDLFECIEQSEHKRLSELQARYVFAQVVDAVYYLDKHGISHRDIKDENLVIDRDLKVKLIDFGSASAVDPDQPRPYYTLFYGTTAYASPEILLKKVYQAAPAEIWTLGVLLSYLLTGSSPFPTVKDAINGRIVVADLPGLRLSRSAMSLMHRCLDPDPQSRATIAEVKAHRWFR